eukprot:jgi/Botrbrau1/7088/Bobra.0165s0110.1
MSDRSRASSERRVPSRSRSRSRSRSGTPRGGRGRGFAGSPARSPPRAGTRGSDQSLYVNGLSSRVTEEDLREFFGKEGEVQDARIVYDPRTQESRGFAFISYVNAEDQERAVKYLEGAALKGRIIHIEKAKRGRPRTPTPGEYRGTRSIRDIPQRDPGRRGGYGRDDYGGRYRDNGYRRRSPSPYRRSPSPYGRDRRGYR